MVLVGCALFLAFVPGCGDDDVVPGTDAGPGMVDSGMGGNDAGPGGMVDSGPGGMVDSGPGGMVDAGPGGGGDGGMAMAPTCLAYCTAVQTACTGSNMQYTGMDMCMTACAAMTPGTIGMTGGDTVGCRLYHAGAAAEGGAAATTHCPHAGPTGGGVCA